MGVVLVSEREMFLLYLRSRSVYPKLLYLWQTKEGWK
jgi:hypothetical protein